jgi:hypothetical protein
VCLLLLLPAAAEFDGAVVPLCASLALGASVMSTGCASEDFFVLEICQPHSLFTEPRVPGI